MKKLLALVLALVMTLSLATVSTNAAFEDAADISYEEAANVLSAVGVFVGDGKNFHPKAGLNREQAAKLVAYLALGEDVAEALPAVAMFDDVAASSWAAKYIAYCADAGIITGDGAGKFFPTAPVDGYAFAKMVMCALGYIAEAEGFVGGNWQINVAKLAKELDLAKGGVDLSKALTREQAAQVMLNAVKCAPVKYEATGSTVTIGNVVVEKDYGKAQPDGTGVYYEQTWDTLGWTTQTDDFGRISTEWTYKTDVISNVANDVADFVITKDMTAKEMASLLKGYKIKVAGGSYKVENDTDYASLTTTNAGVTVTTSTSTLAEALDALTADGKVVEIFADKNLIIDQIVTISYETDEITDIEVDEKTGDVTYTFANAGAYTNTEDTTAVVFAATPAEDDIVTLVDSVNGPIYVYPTTSVTGALTSYTQDGVYTIGGKTYTESDASASPALVIDDEAVYYLDQYGYIVEKTGVAATESSDYAYVLGVLGKSAAGFDGYTPAAQVKVLLADGTVGIYDMKVAKKSGNYYVVDADGEIVYDVAEDSVTNADDSFAWFVGKAFSYVVSGNTIALKAVPTVAAADEVYAVALDATAGMAGATYVVKNDAAMDTAYTGDNDALLNDKTVFVFFDADDDEEVDAVVTGSANLGDKEFCYDARNLVVGSWNEAGTVLTAKVVFVLGGYQTVAEEVDTYGFVNKDVYSVSKDSDEVVIRTYTLTTADGETVSVTAKSPFVSADGLYKYNTDKTVGSALSERYVEGTCVVEGTSVKIGGGFYTMTADTKVVDCSETYTKMDDAMVMAYTDKNGKALVAVFIVDALS